MTVKKGYRSYLSKSSLAFSVMMHIIKERANKLPSGHLVQGYKVSKDINFLVFRANQ